MRPPAFETLNDFLNDRSSYPDEFFRSVKMKMLRGLREYIVDLEFQNEALQRENAAKGSPKGRPDLVPIHERDKLIAEVAKAAIEAICTGRTK